MDYTTRVKTFAKAVKQHEGWWKNSRSFRNNNPGNIRFSAYTQSLGAIGKDKDRFCIFKDYDSGFNALCQFITDAANGELIPYRRKRERPSSFTIADFFNVYSPSKDNNNPQSYSSYVALRLKVSSTYLIKDLI